MGESPLLVAGATIMVVVLFCICAALFHQRMFVEIGFELIISTGGAPYNVVLYPLQKHHQSIYQI